MPDYVYKVVYMNNSEELVSISTTYRLKYDVGRWTRRKPYSPGILCFQTVDQCLDFCGADDPLFENTYVLKCEYEGEVLMVDFLLYQSCMGAIGEEFLGNRKDTRENSIESISRWRDDYGVPSVFVAPTGTISVEAVKPVEILGNAPDLTEGCGGLRGVRIF